MGSQAGMRLGLCSLALFPLQALAAGLIGHIEFYGYKGIDADAVRKALPVREGDPYADTTKEQVREAVANSIGRAPTDVTIVCCDDDRNRLIFIGLPGASSKSFQYNPEPGGNSRVSSEVVSLYDRLSRALAAAVRKGGPQIREDESAGYSLIGDPVVRPLQLQMRSYALKNERESLLALQSSSSAQHRRIAAEVLGYARHSRRQVLALAQAARDSDSETRNNAVRALSVLARSKAEFVNEIPPDVFIEMLKSGVWTDRNKGASLLASLTARRDPELLAKLRLNALDALIEMSLWRRPGHAYSARMILGRIAGLPEKRLQEIAWNGSAEDIVGAVSVQSVRQ
jgi:hypothetical protein